MSGSKPDIAEKEGSASGVRYDPRDIQAKNVAGSTAGASSGDFHVYRQQRRVELERLERMQNEADQKKEADILWQAAEERRMKEENKTAKRAAKRKRKKELRKTRKKSKVVGNVQGPERHTTDEGSLENASKSLRISANDEETKQGTELAQATTDDSVKNGDLEQKPEPTDLGGDRDEQ